MTDLQKKQIVAMRQQHATYAAISDALGIPQSTIKTYCRKIGLMGDRTPSKPVCKNCGGELTNTPGARPRLFCSDHCKQTWWNKHRTDFDAVQDEIARRQGLGRSYSGSSIFASKLICGDCGGFYGQKVWHSTDAYRRVIWRCNSKFKGEAKCETPTLDTDTIQQMFLAAYNQLMTNRDQLLRDCETMRELVNDCPALDAEIDSLNEEIQVVAGLVSQCIKENATTEQSQDDYAKKYNRLVKRYEKATARLKVVTEERESRMQRDRELRIFIGSIEKQPLILNAWDERLWIGLLDTATVNSNNSITFRFKNGTEITIQA